MATTFKWQSSRRKLFLLNKLDNVRWGKVPAERFSRVQGCTGIGQLARIERRSPSAARLAVGVWLSELPHESIGFPCPQQATQDWNSQEKITIAIDFGRRLPLRQFLRALADLPIFHRYSLISVLGHVIWVASSVQHPFV
jgi:hypothetical protein